MTQEEIDVPAAPDYPPLPEPPAYWPSTVSKYARHRIQRRDHCHVDVRLLYDGVTKLPARLARWRRRALPTNKPADDLLLCDQHAREYRTRDNAVRAKAGLKPLDGAG